MQLHTLKEKLLIRLKNRYQDGHTKILGSDTLYVDKSSFLFMYEEIFEKEIYHFESENNKPLIIDCGANIGLSILYFKKLYPNCQVVAFEPDKKIFQVLEKNVGRIENVRLINSAVAGKEGSYEFFSEGADGGRIADSSDTKNVVITAVTLSPFLKENVDLLKIDIEGAEYEVLKEIAPILSGVKRIFLEYHSFADKKQTLGEILDILVDAGFRYYLESGGVRSSHPFTKRETHLNFDLQVNIFAYRI